MARITPKPSEKPVYWLVFSEDAELVSDPKLCAEIYPRLRRRLADRVLALQDRSATPELAEAALAAWRAILVAHHTLGLGGWLAVTGLLHGLLHDRRGLVVASLAAIPAEELSWRLSGEDRVIFQRLEAAETRTAASLIAALDSATASRLARTAVASDRVQAFNILLRGIARRDDLPVANPGAHPDIQKRLADLQSAHAWVSWRRSSQAWLAENS